MKRHYGGKIGEIMASDDRFYMLDFRHRPVLRGDISSLLKIDGLIVSGGGTSAALMLPSTSRYGRLPEILVGPAKTFQRKARWEISGLVQQKVYVADNYSCMYCKRKMGEVQLTIDHFIPLEMRGVNNTSNYLSACRRCNKDKGSEDPKEYCKRNKLNYEFFVSYLKTRKV